MTIAIALALGLSFLASPAEAQRRRRLPDFEQGAHALSLFGGQALGRGKRAIAAGGIFPGLFFQYSAGTSERFDLGVRVDLLWGSPYSSSTLGYGVQVAMPMRLQLGAGRKVFFALRLSPDVVFGSFYPYSGSCRCVRRDRFGNCIERSCRDYYYYDRTQGFGVGCDIGLNVGIPLRSVNIIFGITSPIHFVFLTEVERTDFYFPVAPYAGAEVRLTQRLNVFGLGQFGYNIYVPEDGSTRNVTFLRVWGGIEYGL